jgi:hypothetical protein
MGNQLLVKHLLQFFLGAGCGNDSQFSYEPGASVRVDDEREESNASHKKKDAFSIVLVYSIIAICVRGSV